MENLLKNLRMKYKLSMLVAVALLGMLVIGFAAMMSLRDSILLEKRLKTRHLVESAFGIAETYYRSAQEGRLSQEEAKQAAINTIKGLRYADNNYFWINDMQPKMIMHPLKPELDGKDLSDFKDPKGKKLFMEFVDAVKKEGEGFVYYLWPKPGLSEPVSKVSFVKGFEPWGWIIGSGIYIDDVNMIIRGKLIRFSITVMVILCLMTALSWLISKNITSPIADITTKVEHIARGDLTVIVDYTSKDEIGILSQDTNKILGTLQTVLRDISDKTVNILRDATSLTVHGKNVAQKVIKDLERTSSAAAATEEMSTTTADISRNVTAVSHETESAKKTSSQGKIMIKQTVSAIEEVNKQIEMASGKVNVLAEFSRKIDEIVFMIKDIADQTNLLALNAAIEAARAGEQGRGFAVVADEVRKLAQRTANATSEINSILNSIRAGTSDATKMMDLAVEKAKSTEELAEQMDKSFMQIYQSFERVSDMVYQVASATEEQSATAVEISDNLTGIAGDAKESSTTIKEMVESFDRFGAGAKDFLTLLNKFTDPVLRIRVLKADYVIWIHRLMDFLDKKETLYVPQEFDPENSRMGIWYYGEGKELFGNLTSFRDLAVPHKQLHEIGSKMHAEMIKGDMDALKRHLTDALHLSSEIISVIDRLEAEHAAGAM